jgi:hypothetical protein
MITSRSIRTRHNILSQLNLKLFMLLDVYICILYFPTC